MNLRPKTGFIIGGTFLLLLCLEFAGAVAVILGGIRAAEQETTQRSADQVRNALDERIRYLDGLAADYGTWDDTFAFVQSRDPRFIQSNFQTAALLKLKVNLVLFLDPSGRILYAKAIDLDRQTEAELPFARDAPLSELKLLRPNASPQASTDATHPDEGRRGILLLGRHPALAASRPILRTDGTGPSAGYVVFARYFDHVEIAELAHTTHLTMAAYAPGDSLFMHPPAWLRPLVARADTSMIWTARGDHLKAYTAMADLSGRPASLIELDLPRPMHRQGIIALRFFALSLLITGLIVGGITLALMQRAVISRVLGLSRAVLQIGRSRDIKQRITARGSDELTTLAQGINQMLTSLEQTENELQKARLRAEKDSRIKSEFLANMSHEIRTPMNGVIGMTRILLDTDLKPSQSEIAGNIDLCARSLLELVDDILDYSKIEARKLALEPIPMDLRSLVEETVRVHGMAAAGKSVEMILHYDAGAPTQGRGDPVRIRQILSNLLSNAVKFTEKGEVYLKVSCIGKTGDKAWMGFTVQDTGIGIPKDRIDRLFGKFEQIDASTTRRFGGTGLGLAISHELVTLMGGEIVVSSNPGAGATFSLTLPFPLLSAPLESEAQVPDLTGLRVLIADDNPRAGLALQEQLNVWGARSELVASSDTAWARVAEAERSENPIDALFLDHSLCGARVGEHILECASEEGCPALILLCSGRELAWSETQNGLPIFGRLSKPVCRTPLLHLVDRLRHGHSAPGPWLQDSQTTLPGGSFRRPRLTPFAWGRRTPPKVLLVDDDLMNQKVAAYSLEEFGCSVDIAHNGREAVELWARTEYDAVLMDCLMPEMDGLAAAEEIRRREEGGRHTPILAMTASAMAEDRERCLAAGMDEYLTKPMHPEILHQALSRFFGVPVESPLLRYQDMPGFLEELVRVFLRDAPPYLDGLEEALACGDAQQVVFHAHSLKGMAGHLDLSALVLALQTMEDRGRSGALQQIRDALPELKLLFESQVGALEDLSATLDYKQPAAEAA